MTNEKTKRSFDEKIADSKFDFCKNMKWFLIAPILLVVVGIVLLCTLGFNLGFDFTGGSSMTIYTNSEGVYEEYTSYDLDSDMNEIEEKVQQVLQEHGLTVNSIQATTFSNQDLDLDGVGAVLVRYQNDKTLSNEEIQEENRQIQLELLKAFGYFDDTNTVEDLDTLDEAGFVANGGIITATVGIQLVMITFIGLVVALVLIALYAGLRQNFTSALAIILAVLQDLLVVTAMMLICRIEVGTSFIVALFAVLCYSVYNTFVVFANIKADTNTTLHAGQKLNNSKIANGAVKEILPRQIVTTVVLLVVLLLVTIIGVVEVRNLVLPILFGVLASFYSSVFIAPALWAIAYKPSKKKKAKKQTTESKEETVVNA